jgi:LmbE family N-acetylglucosaminyl deacetylase
MTNLKKEDVVLILAPHADDEVLGAGGFIQLAKTAGAKVYVLFFSVYGLKLVNGGYLTDVKSRKDEIKAVMSKLNIDGYDIMFDTEKEHLRLDTIAIKDMVDWAEAKSACSLSKVKPTFILVPSCKHNNQDHRRVYEVGLSLTRTNPSQDYGRLCVLSYEIPGTGLCGLDSFSPNVYYELSKELLESKCSAFALYKSQVAPKPRLRSIHAINVLAMHRGLEAGYEYAEGFELLRLRFSR